MNESSKHEFALYFSELSSAISHIKLGDAITIDDPQLIMRITSVLRLKQGEQLVLFDQSIHVHVSIDSASKKTILCNLISKELNKVIKPSISFVLPMLKKDDFESSLYSLVELGANKIYLVTTQKTQRAWGGEKELERCERVMIAAAEQSKNFAFPELNSPVTLASYFATVASTKIPKIYFDPEGQDCFELINDLRVDKSTELILMVGPEGDLTHDEKQSLRSIDFRLCQLTPTILRSSTAVAVGLGMIRSVLK
jgi:16S rRNA (uracil1498-N3)-methyltransferase